MATTSVRCGDRVLARLSPARTDDLTLAAAAIVGEVFFWTATRVIDDGEAYEGQLRMELGRTDFERTRVWWVPLCDLSEVTVVGKDSEVAEECALLHRHPERAKR